MACPFLARLLRAAVTNDFTRPDERSDGGRLDVLAAAVAQSTPDGLHQRLETALEWLLSVAVPPLMGHFGHDSEAVWLHSPTRLDVLAANAARAGTVVHELAQAPLEYVLQDIARAADALVATDDQVAYEAAAPAIVRACLVAHAQTRAAGTRVIDLLDALISPDPP